MRVRFGYVAMATELQNGSPNRTTTFKMLERLPSDVWTLKLRQLAEENLQTQLRVLKYNNAYDIHVFRFTSKLVPLATHEAAMGWDYAAELASSFRSIGDYVQSHQFRVSFHPDHFVNLTAKSPEVLASSLAILAAHEIQCQAMGLADTTKLNIHMGGAYGNKEVSAARFCKHWKEEVPDAVRKRITLENDDKTFTVSETLACCEGMGIPMVLDIHHHRCNPGDDVDVDALLPRIFATWGNQALPPKIHASSPRGTTNGTELRSHSDFLAVEDVLPFLKVAAAHVDELDVMIEAKGKDRALRQLMKKLGTQAGVKVIDGASIDVTPN